MHRSKHNTSIYSAPSAVSVIHGGLGMQPPRIKRNAVPVQNLDGSTSCLNLSEAPPAPAIKSGPSPRPHGLGPFFCHWTHPCPGSSPVDLLWASFLPQALPCSCFSHKCHWLFLTPWPCMSTLCSPGCRGRTRPQHTPRSFLLPKPSPFSCHQGTQTM